MAKVITTIMDGFAQSTNAVREINRDNMAAVRADSKALWDEARTPDPGVVKVRQAKGFGNKVKAIGENIREGAAQASEIEQQRRADIQSHEAYRTILTDQRAARQAMTHNPYSRFNF